MAGRDCIDMTKRILDHHGLSYEVKKGKHLKVVVSYAEQKQTIVMAASVSDRRATLNLYSTIRRLLTSMGVDFLDCRGLVYN